MGRKERRLYYYYNGMYFLIQPVTDNSQPTIVDFDQPPPEWYRGEPLPKSLKRVVFTFSNSEGLPDLWERSWRVASKKTRKIFEDFQPETEFVPAIIRTGRNAVNRSSYSILHCLTQVDCFNFDESIYEDREIKWVFRARRLGRAKKGPPIF